MTERTERPPEFDPEHITRKLARIGREEDAWRALFERYGIEPHGIVYEDLVADPSAAPCAKRWSSSGSRRPRPRGRRSRRSSARRTTSPSSGSSAILRRPLILNPMNAIESQQIELHGHRVNYRIAGEGPLIVLVHGITSTSECWREVMPWLADDFTVLAPDLLGHGESAKPRGDYSLGAYASGIRDLIVALGLRARHIPRAFAGRGRGDAARLPVPGALRADGARLERRPRAGGALSAPRGRAAGLRVGPARDRRSRARATPAARSAGCSSRVGVRPTPDLTEFARGYGSLADSEARSAFIHTLRGVIDPAGQRVSARDRLYLAAEVPSLRHVGRARPHHPDRARPPGPCGDAGQPLRRDPGCRALPPARPAAALRRGAGRVHGRHQAVRGERRRPAQTAAGRRAGAR